MTQRELERRGLKVERRGQAWSIVGAGVSLLVADLRLVQMRDLNPFEPSVQLPRSWSEWGQA